MATKKSVKKTDSGEVKKQTKATKPNNPNLSYTQTEFLNNLQGFCGLEKKSEAKELAEDIRLLLTDCLKRGYKVPLFSLGKIQVKKTKARNGVNPATREKIRIPAKKKVRFTPAKLLKDEVL